MPALAQEWTCPHCGVTEPQQELHEECPGATHARLRSRTIQEYVQLAPGGAVLLLLRDAEWRRWAEAEYAQAVSSLGQAFSGADDTVLWGCLEILLDPKFPLALASWNNALSAWGEACEKECEIDRRLTGNPRARPISTPPPPKLQLPPPGPVRTLTELLIQAERMEEEARRTARPPIEASP